MSIALNAAQEWTVIQMADYVSKEIAIERIKRVKPHVVMSEYGVGYERGLKDAIGILNATPSADVQPVDRWISVDERLPKTGESVLVYVAINKNLKGFGECKPEIRIGWLDDGGKWALQFSNMDYSEVLYWMPLPEPPKDGDTND